MVRVSNCGHDENGVYSGGRAGDQTRTEWYLRSWYAYPWNYVIRWRDTALGDLFADLATEAAENNLIGYDQYQRDTFWQHLQASAYRPAKITVACEADCSSGTIALIRAVGYLKGIAALQACDATYTGNMMNYFRSANGQKYFEILTGKYLTDSSYARRGDINLNERSHVNITVDNGANAGTSSGGTASGSGSGSNTGTSSGSAGTVSGTTGQTEGKYMFEVGTVQSGSSGNDVKLLQRLLRSNGCKGADGKAITVDGSCGTNTVAAIRKYQKKKGLSVDGIAGQATWKSILLR